jgi:uncharacterized membrane protein YvlD (DUF360 family)
MYAIAGFLGSTQVKLPGIEAAFIVVGIWSALTAILRPVLFAVKLVTSPLNWLTLGLYGSLLSFLVNMMVLVGLGMTKAFSGFEVPGGFPAAVKVALLFSIVNAASTVLVGSRKEKR